MNTDITWVVTLAWPAAQTTALGNVSGSGCKRLVIQLEAGMYIPYLPIILITVLILC